MILLNWSFSSAEQLLHCLLLSQLFQLLSIPVSRSKKTTDNKINGKRDREEKSFRLSFLFCTFRFPEQGHKVVNHLGCCCCCCSNLGAGICGGGGGDNHHHRKLNSLYRATQNIPQQLTLICPSFHFCPFSFFSPYSEQLANCPLLPFFQSLFLVETEPRNVRKLFFCAEYTGTGGECGVCVCVFTHHLTRHDLSISISVFCCCTFSSFSSFSSLF